MAESTEAKSKESLDPGKITAWINLVVTVFGFLAGLASSTGSIYGPIDTAFFYIFNITFMLYAGIVTAGLLLGLGTFVFGDDYLRNIHLVIAAILVVVIAVPIGLENAARAVTDSSNLIGLTFVRFVGLGMLVLLGWLAYRYILTPKK